MSKAACLRHAGRDRTPEEENEYLDKRLVKKKKCNGGVVCDILKRRSEWYENQ
jgi:hypothetical protein